MISYSKSMMKDKIIKVFNALLMSNQVFTQRALLATIKDPRKNSYSFLPLFKQGDS